MSCRTIFIVLSLAAVANFALGNPILGFPDDDIQDSAIVESTVREVRAIKPSDLDIAAANHHKSFGEGDNDDIGYARKMQDKGKHGYQKFDSFHKKGGDSYGYEKHDSFGVEKKGGHNSKTGHTAKKNDGKKENAKNAKYQEADASGEADYDGDYDDASAEAEGDAGDYESDGGDAGASEAEAGVEQSGYDEADAVNYENPPGYTYGGGGEYDF